jgi:hypothetical protein
MHVNGWIVVADENMRAPMLGLIIKTLQAITVDRTDPQSRKKSSAQIEVKYSLSCVFVVSHTIVLCPSVIVTLQG